MGESIEDYQVLNLLGKGAFACVYRARALTTGQEVAIKMIDKKLMQAAGMVARVRKEVEIHSRLKHPAILELYNYFEDSNYVYLVLEMCHNGELYRYLKTNCKVLSEQEARVFLRQIVQGMLYLHSHGILHRDLTLANLLLTKDMDVKIADFGLATQLSVPDEKHFTMCGTPNYISPEIAMRGAHGLEADVWSLGCMLYTFLVGKPPFDTQAVRTTLNRVISAEFDMPDHLSLEAKDLIKSLLKKNPKERIGLHDILEHPFLTNTSLREYKSRGHHNMLTNEASMDSGHDTMNTMSTNTSNTRYTSASRLRPTRAYPTPSLGPLTSTAEEEEGGSAQDSGWSWRGNNGVTGHYPTHPPSPPVRLRSSPNERVQKIPEKTMSTSAETRYPSSSHNSAMLSTISNPTFSSHQAVNLNSNKGTDFQTKLSHYLRGAENQEHKFSQQQSARGFNDGEDGSGYHGAKLRSYHGDNNYNNNPSQHGRRVDENPDPEPPSFPERKQDLERPGFMEVERSGHSSMTRQQLTGKPPTASHHCNYHHHHRANSKAGEEELRVFPSERGKSMNSVCHVNRLESQDELQDQDLGKGQNRSRYEGTTTGNWLKQDKDVDMKSVSSGQQAIDGVDNAQARGKNDLVTTGTEVVSKDGRRLRDLASPLNSLRLRPIRQKTRNAVMNILEDGEVCLEFFKSKDNQDRVVEVCKISADGRKIIVYQPKIPHQPVQDRPPTPPGDTACIYTYHDLPSKYWKKYQYAARFVKLVRSKTPKVTMYTTKAKCMLMENSPSADFEVVFADGAKVNCNPQGARIIEQDGTTITLGTESGVHHLSADAQKLWENVKQLHQHCLDLEAALSIAEQKAGIGHYFPVIVGRRPTMPCATGSSSDGKQAPSGEKKNNRGFLQQTEGSPVAVPAPTMLSFDGTVMSSHVTRVQEPRATKDVHNTLAGAKGQLFISQNSDNKRQAHGAERDLGVQKNQEHPIDSQARVALHDRGRKNKSLHEKESQKRTQSIEEEVYSKTPCNLSQKENMEHHDNTGRVGPRRGGEHTGRTTRSHQRGLHVKNGNSSDRIQDWEKEKLKNTGQSTSMHKRSVLDGNIVSDERPPHSGRDLPGEGRSRRHNTPTAGSTAEPYPSEPARSSSAKRHHSNQSSPASHARDRQKSQKRVTQSPEVTSPSARVLKRMFVPDVGWASQHCDGSVWVQFNDGTQVCVSSSQTAIKYVDQAGKVARYGETDHLPSHVMKKLEKLPAVVEKLAATGDS
ncbi:serine/threonine-protein kinase PLK4 [Lingula anatina]|uniref:Serine/threonine-protein kinase PLK4 n=1 Tax=Lingula anatina TaxID=7574 RepID=A0A1S3K7W6_LINAN|nr:serine/threonine-protein kinase PLK4 [Lingula anatina]|eukprot:XP_013418582.1 serine/threonine-protein kinase PLK4 [Lingula anatina]